MEKGLADAQPLKARLDGGLDHAPAVHAIETLEIGPFGGEMLGIVFAPLVGIPEPTPIAALHHERMPEQDAHGIEPRKQFWGRGRGRVARGAFALTYKLARLKEGHLRNATDVPDGA